MANKQEFINALMGLDVIEDDIRRELQLKALDVLINAQGFKALQEAVTEDLLDEITDAGDFNDFADNLETGKNLFDKEGLFHEIEEEEITLAKIQRAAAQKRIQISLPFASNEELNQIIQAGDDENLRKLLGDMPSLGSLGLKNKAWMGDDDAFINVPPILDNEQLRDIKARATVLMIDNLLRPIKVNFNSAKKEVNENIDLISNVDINKNDELVKDTINVAIIKAKVSLDLMRQQLINIEKVVNNDNKELLGLQPNSKIKETYDATIVELEEEITKLEHSVFKQEKKLVAIANARAELVSSGDPDTKASVTDLQNHIELATGHIAAINAIQDLLNESNALQIPADITAARKLAEAGLLRSEKNLKLKEQHIALSQPIIAIENEFDVAKKGVKTNITFIQQCVGDSDLLVDADMNTSIVKAKEALHLMGLKLDDLTRYKQEKLTAAGDENKPIIAQVEALEEKFRAEIEEQKLAIAAESISLFSVVKARSALVYTLDVNLPPKTNVQECKDRLALAQAHVAAMNNAIELLKAGGVNTLPNEVIAAKSEADKALKEHELALRLAEWSVIKKNGPAKLDENLALRSDEAIIKYSKEKLVQIDQLEKLLKKIKFDFKDYDIDTQLKTLEDVLSAEKRKIPANFLIIDDDRPGCRTWFVKAGTVAADVNVPAYNPGDPNETSLAPKKPVPVSYEAYFFQPGDVLMREVHLPSEDAKLSIKGEGKKADQPAVAAVEASKAIIMIDHTGKITDITPKEDRAKHSMAQKLETAKTMAENFYVNPGKPTDIIIRGRDPDIAKMVCAYLLKMHGSAKLNIVSYVPGFELKREANMFGSYSKFIEKTLNPEHVAVNNEELKQKRDGVSRFVDAMRANREAAHHGKHIGVGDKVELADDGKQIKLKKGP